MSDKDDTRPAKLDTDDLELLITAIEGLSAKIEVVENSAPALTQAQAALFTSQLAEKATSHIRQSTTSNLEALKSATGKLEHAATSEQIRLFQGHRSDVEKMGVENRVWRLCAVVVVVVILTGAWFTHGFIVKTVVGCYALGGNFYHAKSENGDPSFCFFDR